MKKNETEDDRTLDSFEPFQRPEDDPERKKQDLKLALIAGTTVIVVIALAILLWMFWL